MFDIGFLELILISIVALLVLGPDRLPGAIRTMGLWIGRLRRSFNNIRRDIEQEIGADEIRRQLRNEAIMEKFNSTRNQVTNTIESVKKEAESVKDDLDLKKQFSDINKDAKDKDAGQDKSGVPEGPDPVEALSTNDPTVSEMNNPGGKTGASTPQSPPPTGAQTGKDAKESPPEGGGRAESKQSKQ